MSPKEKPSFQGEKGAAKTKEYFRGEITKFENTIKETKEKLETQVLSEEEKKELNKTLDVTNNYLREIREKEDQVYSKVKVE